MPSLAARTRAAVRRRPALRAALAAGAVNHTAAARLLAADLDLAADDHDAVAAALRRYGDALTLSRSTVTASVRMVTGVGTVAADGDGDSDDPGSSATLLSVGDRAVREGAGSETALVVEGSDVDARSLSAVLPRLAAEGVSVETTGATAGRAVVVVPRRAGADAVRAVEDALDAVPTVHEDGEGTGR